MKKYTGIIMTASMVLTILISNALSFVDDGRRLDELRGSVLRLHILANSDNEEDQRLKLCVRDALLEQSGELFACADSLEEAEAAAEAELHEIERIARETLESQGSSQTVTAKLVDMHFDERFYDGLTMPAGDYKALRVELGEAEGHNWWCVMYPPLCLPAACRVTINKTAEEAHFDKKELDIMYRPKKYRIRFAVWDKLKRLFD
ncbi:MAG: stage II sporulation protein R [Ruminococcus sp.]|nr:stage II sporulation protein R [Ruminococcus sp.]